MGAYVIGVILVLAVGGLVTLLVIGAFFAVLEAMQNE